jgi:hypothetical protein
MTPLEASLALDKFIAVYNRGEIAKTEVLDWFVEAVTPQPANEFWCRIREVQAATSRWLYEETGVYQIAITTRMLADNFNLRRSINLGIRTNLNPVLPGDSERRYTGGNPPDFFELRRNNDSPLFHGQRSR